MINVAAVILNYNSYEDSIKCANYLKEQEGVNLNIIIVDNCSSDNSVVHLKKYCEKIDVKLLCNNKNKGFSAGNNVGLKYANKIGCKYALIINPDIEIRDRFYMKKIVDKMEEDKKIAVLGTDIISMKNEHQNPMRELSYWEELFWPLEIIGNKKSNDILYVVKNAKSGYCKKLTGCCILVDMNFLHKINYLDENVFLYCEEPILAAQVKKYNRKEYYYDGAVAYHMHIDNTKGNKEKRVNRLFESRKYYLTNYSGYGKIKLKLLFISKWIYKKIMLRNMKKY